MNILSSVVILATLAVGEVSGGVLDEIEARHRRGEIDVQTYHRYRVAAIRRPELLPADLRARRVGLLRRSGTRYLVEAFQHVVRTGDYGSELHRLLQPPDDHPYTVESTSWPIRVSYELASQQAYAEEIIAAADLSYDVQIGDFGFYQPVIEPGYSPYRFYIEEAGQGVAGYTAPYDMDPDALHPSCYTYIVIDPSLSGDGLGSTVAHEINHSMQATMDCLELTTFWENTAVYMEGATNPDWEDDTYWFIPYFQQEPWRALDYFQSGEGYPYGGVLWLYYLTERLAPTDGPVLVREIWEACMQNSFSVNEPDYFDAIEAVAVSRGAPLTTMEEIYLDFAEARYFVGENDDGGHIGGASVYENAEPAISASLTLADLPVVEEQPPVAELPAPYGTSYVELDLQPGSTHPLSVGIDGSDSNRWAARVVLIGAEATESREMEVDPDHGTGQVLVDPTGFDRLLLVTVNLGTADHDPDDELWTGSDYYFSIEPVRDPPEIISVNPGAVKRGQQNLHVRLTGENFVYGDGFAILFGDPTLSVVSIDTLSETEVLFTLTVPASADLGLTDVTVTNGDGQQTTAPDALAVVDELDELEPKPGGCQTGGAPGPLSLLLCSLLLVALTRRRS